MKTEVKSFLYDYQLEAVNNASNGCILNGGVGSGKSRTGLYYYYKENGGELVNHQEHVPMKNPKDLYIITTAMKRDTCEWECELANFFMSTYSEISMYDNTIVIDSWNNIKKYKTITGAFFIFDEDKVTGSGEWVKTFLEITKHNDWIILSATAGDTWMDYMPVFVANGFYKNKTEFASEHIIYSRFTKWPQIDRYVNTSRLIRLRDKVLISMDFERTTIPHHTTVYTDYYKTLYKDSMKNRWNPYTAEPIQQASQLCYVLRKIVNSDESRIYKMLDILEDKDTAIIFYNFDYELEMLRNVFWNLDSDTIESCDSDSKLDFEIAEWNGHMHQEIPTSKKWVYLVQYTAGCEGWNCTRTDTIIFFSQNYSYKVLTQACGRIDRLNTPFRDLYYYHLKSRSSIDVSISRALDTKKKFNESKFTKHMM